MRVYPEKLSNDSSDAEATVFDAFKAATGGEGVALFQREWLRPGDAGPQQGEADLITAHPEWGVLIIEIKGGVIDVDRDGTWTSNGHRIKDPFSQARRSMHELRRRFSQAPATRGYSYPLGYAVWFPHVDALSLPDRLEADVDLILDASDLQDPVAALDRPYSYWNREGNYPAPATRGVDALVNLIAPRWHLRPLLGPAIARDAAQQLELTQQQFRLLRFLANQPRALIAGCAGSGKTLLAVEKCRRLARDGHRVLYTCYNRRLARLVQETLQGDDIVALTYHELCYRYGKEAGLELAAPDSGDFPNDYFDQVLPDALAHAVDVLGPRFDAMVVDEAQDFKDFWWVPLLGLLSGGDESPLYIFFDPLQDLYQRSQTWPVPGEPFVLDTNVRNTRFIHDELLRTVPLDAECIGPQGREIERIRFTSSEVHAVGSVLRRLVHEDKVDPRDLVVLTPRKRGRSVWSDGMQFGHLRLVWDEPTQANDIRVSSIHSFKGLERPVVLLTEMDQIYPASAQQLLYVARSRATSHLVEFAKGEAAGSVASEG